VAVLAVAMLSAVDAFAKPDRISGSGCHLGNGSDAVPSKPSSLAASDDRTDGIRLTWSDPTPCETNATIRSSEFG
jgi:hypothetical protein